MNQGKEYADMKWKASHFRQKGELGWTPMADFIPEQHEPIEFLLNDGSVQFVRNQINYPPRIQS